MLKSDSYCIFISSIGRKVFLRIIRHTTKEKNYNYFNCYPYGTSKRYRKMLENDMLSSKNEQKRLKVFCTNIYYFMR